jgi:hypothetical protein
MSTAVQNSGGHKFRLYERAGDRVRPVGPGPTVEHRPADRRRSGSEVEPCPKPERGTILSYSIKKFSTPVDTMGCDKAKWKEMDPPVRDTRDGLPSSSYLSLARLLGSYYL